MQGAAALQRQLDEARAEAAVAATTVQHLRDEAAAAEQRVAEVEARAREVGGCDEPFGGWVGAEPLGGGGGRAGGELDMAGIVAGKACSAVGL